MHGCIREFIKRLAREHAEVLTLKDLDGLTNSEISTRLARIFHSRIAFSTISGDGRRKTRIFARLFAVGEAEKRRRRQNCVFLRRAPTLRQSGAGVAPVLGLRKARGYPSAGANCISRA
jgi:hypothetical protein